MSKRDLVYVGLGNPGKHYEKTRHNLGFLVVEAFAASQGLSFKHETRFHAWVAKGKIENCDLHLILPSTYMNESGVAVRQYLDFYKIGIEHILVVCDDTALPFNTMRLRKTGRPGGHNGLKSIEAHLGTDHYARLRMGIGTNCTAQILREYVLEKFSSEELAVLKDFVHQGAMVLKSLMNESITKVMNSINTKVTL